MQAPLTLGERPKLTRSVDKIDPPKPIVQSARAPLTHQSERVTMNSRAVDSVAAGPPSITQTRTQK